TTWRNPNATSVTRTAPAPICAPAEPPASAKRGAQRSGQQRSQRRRIDIARRAHCGFARERLSAYGPPEPSRAHTPRARAGRLFGRLRRRSHGSALDRDLDGAAVCSYVRAVLLGNRLAYLRFQIYDLRFARSNRKSKIVHRKSLWIV